MTHNKNNIPIHEEQQFIQEEQLSVEEILSKFKQPIPDKFIELGQPKKYWGSTEGLDKQLCERYTFKYKDKSITLDITQELSNKLELNSEKSFCVVEKVLERKKTEGGITIENETELILAKPFTIQNLEKDINKLFEKIEELENEQDDYQNKWDNSMEELEQKREIIGNYSLKIEELEGERKQLSSNLQTARIELNNTKILIANIQNLLEINNLDNLPSLPEGETLTTLLARPMPTELSDKQNEIDFLKREKTQLENRISEKDGQISQLNVDKNHIQTKLEELKVKLPKRSWKSFYDWIINNLVERNNYHGGRDHWGKEIINLNEEEKWGWYTYSLFPHHSRRDDFFEYMSQFKIDGYWLTLKQNKKDTYPFLFKRPVFLSMILKLLLKEEGKITFSGGSGLSYSQQDFTIFPYIENKPLKELSNFFTGGAILFAVRDQERNEIKIDGFYDDFQRLFDKWKDDTLIRECCKLNVYLSKEFSNLVK